MSKPRVYGYCDAGCRRRVPTYEEYQSIAAGLKCTPDESGNYILELGKRYRIYRTEDTKISVTAEYANLVASQYISLPDYNQAYDKYDATEFCLTGTDYDTTEGTGGEDDQSDIYVCYILNGERKSLEVGTYTGGTQGLEIAVTSITLSGAIDCYLVNDTGTLLAEDGASAYEIAVAKGFEGTEEEWLASLNGEGGGMTDEQVALLTKLSNWYDDEHYVAMTGTFSMSPTTTTYEMGASQSVKFSWSFSKLPTEVTFNGTAQTAATSGEATVTVTSQSHKTLTYSLYGKYVEGETVSKSLSINFRNKYYYGYKAIPTTLDSDFIKSLDKNGWASAKTISFTPNCTSGTYVWYAYPKRLGAATMWMGGFQGGFEEPTTVSVTNSSGYTEDYYVYRSTNSGIGDLSVQAK